MEHAANRLSIIEWVLQPPEATKAEGFDEALQKLHPWRGAVPLYRSLLERAMVHRGKNQIPSLHFRAALVLDRLIQHGLELS